MLMKKNKNVSCLIRSDRKYYEVFIFAVLMFEFFYVCPGIHNMNEWTVTNYFFSYQDLGFNSRFFIGSIFKIFFEYISASTLYYCIFFIIIITNAFAAIILGNVIRRSPKDRLDSLKVFLALFLASPFSLSFLFDNNNFGRLDTYLIIITGIMLLFIRHNHLKWLIPILCVIATSIHQGYFMTYMPIIAIVLIYECYKNRFKTSSMVLCGASFLLIIFSFVFFQFLAPNLDFKSAADVVKFLSHRTDLRLNEDLIFTEYFINADTWLSDIWQIIKTFAIPYGVCVPVITSPLIAVFFSLWSTAFKKADDKFAKFIVFLCMAAPVISIPLFVGPDWDRWISAIFIVQFLLVFYFLDAGFSCVVESAENIRVFFSKHLTLFIIILIFISLMIFSDVRILFGVYFDRMQDYYNEVIDKYKTMTI